MTAYFSLLKYFDTETLATSDSNCQKDSCLSHSHNKDPQAIVHSILRYSLR